MTKSGITIKKPKDLTKIDVNDLGELSWWTNHLGTSPEKLLLVVEKVGRSIAAIRAELRKK